MKRFAHPVEARPEASGQGFVRCTAEFDQQPAVINAASDWMVDIFGDAGRHSRFAVGTNALPFGVAVEIAALFEIHD